MRIRIAIILLAGIALARAQTHWVVTWGASPAPQLADEQQMRSAKLLFQNQTIREIVHTSIGGDTIRVRLSNAFGQQGVEIGAAHVAQRATGAQVSARLQRHLYRVEKFSRLANVYGSAIAPGSDHVLTFSGYPSVSIPPNAIVLSDPVKLNVPAASDLVISIFLPKASAAAGIHYSAGQTSYIGAGDLSALPFWTEPAPIPSWIFLTGVDMLEPQTASTLVAFGDSITDGAGSTRDTNRRWPDVLASRLTAHGNKIGVLNAGIGGNRILHDAATNVRLGVSALARFDGDVLARPGVKYVIVLEGINDLGHAGTSAPASETVTAENVIAGLRQLIERAHEKGLRIFGATLTPFEGTLLPGYFTREKEEKRKAINTWIRTGKAFDGVVDFDKAVRDPKHPDRMLPSYDSGDHLHPGDQGYKAMGEAVDLSPFI